MKLIIASQNQGKIKEIKSILKSLDIEILTARQIGITEEAIEDSITFEENSLKKARFISKKSGQWAIADDTGICIRALNNAPGVLSARWAGDKDLAQYTLEKMKNIPKNKRQAYFETAAVLFSPDGQYWTFNGKIDGQIIQKPKGKKRPKLPYDVIFMPNGYTETFAEMADDQKNSLSHRGIAFKKLKNFLEAKQYQ